MQFLVDMTPQVRPGGDGNDNTMITTIEKGKGVVWQCDRGRDNRGCGSAVDVIITGNVSGHNPRCLVVVYTRNRFLAGEKSKSRLIDF